MAPPPWTQLWREDSLRFGLELQGKRADALDFQRCVYDPERVAARK